MDIKTYALIKAMVNKDAGNDIFWDALQDNGNRTDYDFAFGGIGWTDHTFAPKYDMQPTNASYMFYKSGITDLKGLLDARGLTLDFSKSKGLTYLFQQSKITRVGEIDTRMCPGLEYLLTSCGSLVSIDKIILKNDGSQTFSKSMSFQNCSSLAEIRFEGVIGQDNFNMQWSKKLSKASIESIFAALSKTTENLTVTLSKDAVDAAFETSPGACDGRDSNDWNDLAMNDVTNWNIALV